MIDDFLMYDLNPGGLLVVLVIHNCVNSMEVKMETARSIEKNGCEIDASVGYKAKGKSTAVTPVGLFVTVDSRCYVYTAIANVDGYFCQGRWCQHCMLNGSLRRRREDQVGMPELCILGLEVVEGGTHLGQGDPR